MKSNVVAALALLALIAQFKGCGSTKPPASSQSTPIASQRSSAIDYASMVDGLRKAGAKVEAAGEVSQPFFAVKGKVIKVNGSDVQVFEYADGAAAEADASFVSSDGSEVRRSKVSWIGPPHFYKKGKLIVLYVGDDAVVLKALDTVLGRQFAGK